MYYIEHRRTGLSKVLIFDACDFTIEEWVQIRLFYKNHPDFFILELR